MRVEIAFKIGKRTVKIYSVADARGGAQALKRFNNHAPERFFFEPRVGLEPTTFSLRMKCSTN